MTILALEEVFTPFLKPDVTWGRKTKTSRLRGLHGLDAAQEVTTLETMLGLIANYAPVVSRGTIVKSCTCLNAVWKVLHLYYGIQSSDEGKILNRAVNKMKQMWFWNMFSIYIAMRISLVNTSYIQSLSSSSEPYIIITVAVIMLVIICFRSLCKLKTLIFSLTIICIVLHTASKSPNSCFFLVAYFSFSCLFSGYCGCHH